MVPDQVLSEPPRKAAPSASSSSTASPFRRTRARKASAAARSSVPPVSGKEGKPSPEQAAEGLDSQR